MNNEAKNFADWVEGEPLAAPDVTAEPMACWSEGEPYLVVLPSGTTNPTYRFFFGF